MYSDQSSLANSQWTLLFSIIHVHDVFNVTTQIRCAIEDLSIYNESNLCKTILDMMCTSMELFISSSLDFRILTVNKQYSLFEYVIVT